MKKLKDFDVKKVKLDNIYGGRVAAETNARTCTVGDNGGNPDVTGKLKTKLSPKTHCIIT